MVINEPKMFINFFWRYAMGKMSINKPLSGLGWRMKPRMKPHMKTSIECITYYLLLKKKSYLYALNEGIVFLFIHLEKINVK